MRGDGTVVVEAKLPEELLSAATVESAKGAPITDGHPPLYDNHGQLNSSNFNRYAKGCLGDRITVEADRLQGAATYWDDELADAVARGDKAEISIGFEMELDQTPGELNGVRYDCIQRNIRINHIASLPRGRAGSEVRAHLDGADGDFAVMQTQENNTMPESSNQTKTQERTDAGLLAELKQWAREQFGGRHDEDESEQKKAPPETDDPDALKKQVTELQAQVAGLEARLREKTAALDAAEKQVDQRIDERSTLIEAAKSVIENFKHDGKDDATIKAEVVQTVGLELPDAPTGQRHDAATVDAYYAAAMRLARERAGNHPDQNRADGEPRLDAAAIEAVRRKRLQLRKA